MGEVRWRRGKRRSLDDTSVHDTFAVPICSDLGSAD